MSREDLEYGLELAFLAAHEVSDIQMDALRRRYTEISKKEGETDD